MFLVLARGAAVRSGKYLQTVGNYYGSKVVTRALGELAIVPKWVRYLPDQGRLRLPARVRGRVRSSVGASADRLQSTRRP